MAIGNMVQAKLTITGTRPLLFHHFGPETIPADGRKEREGAACTTVKNTTVSL